MKVSILTLGCKVNQAESAFIQGSLSNLGFSIVDLTGQPDYCIVNTCTVTAKSDYQSRQLIRRAVRTGSKVVVTGCYSQLSPDEVRKIDGIYRIVLNDNKSSIINMLTNDASTSNMSFSCRSRPYVKVQDGCNNTCTYCIVPKARGRSRSSTIPDILDRISSFENQDYNEIVLTGIHLGSFGRDLKPNVTLSYLLRTILIKSVIRRIRLSSIEVNEINNELMELLQEERICKHIHVPIQSGEDSILALMGRKYTGKQFVSVIEGIKKKVPEIAIGTDVIVGFPGEDEKRFMNTKQLLESLPLSYMHVFPFSPRPGTMAFGMAAQNRNEVKKDRASQLNALNIRKKSEYMSSQVGKVLDIVVEERYGDDSVVGTSSNYLKIRTFSNEDIRRSLIYVRVSGREGNILRGDPIDSP